MSKIFDLHAHVSLQPFHRLVNDGGLKKPDPNHWTLHRKKSNEVVEVFGDVPEYSQTNLDSAINGEVYCIVNSLYPIEKGFVVMGEHSTMPSNVWDNLLSAIIGADVEVINRIQSELIPYFKELEGEYNNIKDNPMKSHNGFSYKLVKNYEEIQNINPGTIAIIQSVEGVHAFADYYIENPDEAEKNNTKLFAQYKESIIKNLTLVKTSWEYPLLYISPAHHFYNHTSGLSKSITGITKLLGLVDRQNSIVNGMHVFDKGITEFGNKVIDLLLSRKVDGQECRRILIDIKHFSPQARLDYYEKLKLLKINNNDKVPIIASHAAVNGKPELTINNNEDDEVHCFNGGNINLFDNEIKMICDSEGIIGIMLDKNRLFDKATKRSHKLSRTIGNKRKLKSKTLEVILRQMLHIVSVTNGNGWRYICIGSDFDGVIGPLDFYDDFSRLKLLHDDLGNFESNDLKESYPKYYNDFINNRTKYLDMIFWKNAMEFLEKFYNDSYLKKVI